MRPLPERMRIVSLSSFDWRLTPTKGGNPGKTPSRSSPWQIAQFLEYDCAPGSFFAAPRGLAVDVVCVPAAGLCVAPADWGAPQNASPHPAIATPHQASRYRSTLSKLLDSFPKPPHAGSL